MLSALRGLAVIAGGGCVCNGHTGQHTGPGACWLLVCLVGGCMVCIIG